MRYFFISLLLFAATGNLRAQETQDDVNSTSGLAATIQLDNSTHEQKLNSLELIAAPLSAAIKRLDRLQASLSEAESEREKTSLESEVEAQKAQIEQLRFHFRNTLGGSEAVEYRDIAIEKKSLQEEVLEVFQPVFNAIREATSEPRELEAVRQALAAAKERKRKTIIVLDRIEKLIKASEDSNLTEELESAKRLWNGRRTEAISQIAVSKAQIIELTKDKRSFWEKLSSGFASFFKSRGMNLLFAITAAVFSFVIIRKLYSLFQKISPTHRKNQHTFAVRIADILAMGFSVLAALLGVIIVFYLRGDWLLLTLVIIFLVGIAWAGKTAIPPYLNQIKMILNLGSVREGERVTFHDLPWRVEKLGFYTNFTNDSLHGGQLRVPIREIMDMISRPIADHEVWFPSEIEDWIVLSDDTYGKVITQTPDQVIVLQLGGSTKTYPTTDFLELFPRNLSHGFRVSVTFGIDYAYQEDCTTTIPTIFQQKLESELRTLYGRDPIKSVQVQFASASASSLDYEILADFDGSVASKWNALRRKIQSICVDACNENGWSIPFTQITLHQAEAPETKE